MPVEYVEEVAAIAANYAAGLNISVGGCAVQPYQPLTVQNGEFYVWGKFYVWFVFGRKTENGAAIAVLHVVKQDPEEDEFEADTQWAARKTNLSAHGFKTEDATFMTKVFDNMPSIEMKNDTVMPIMILGSIMNQKLWYDLPVQVQQNWHIMNDKRPQDEREEFPPLYIIGTRFERLCEVEPSPAAVNEFMEVDIVLMLVRTEFGASK